MRVVRVCLIGDRARFLLILLVRLKLREDFDEFANAPARQRLAIVHSGSSLTIQA